MDMQMLTTLSYAIREGEILLGMKKRGFGAGRWNGFGGKVHDGETIEEAAVREFHEEASIEVGVKDLVQVAVIDFYFRDGKEIHVRVFFTEKWNGEPEETEEMRPQWFHFDDIPYKDMWVDDIHWLPQVLAGKKVIGSVYFGESDEVIEKMEWNEIDSL